MRQGDIRVSPGDMLGDFSKVKKLCNNNDSNCVFSYSCMHWKEKAERNEQYKKQLAELEAVKEELRQVITVMHRHCSIAASVSTISEPSAPVLTQ